MDEATAETAALFNAFDNAMTDGLNDLKQAISSPDLRESSGSSLTEMPPAKRRAPLEDITRRWKLRAVLKPKSYDKCVQTSVEKWSVMNQPSPRLIVHITSSRKNMIVALK